MKIYSPSCIFSARSLILCCIIVQWYMKKNTLAEAKKNVFLMQNISLWSQHFVQAAFPFQLTESVIIKGENRRKTRGGGKVSRQWSGKQTPRAGFLCVSGQKQTNRNSVRVRDVWCGATGVTGKSYEARKPGRAKECLNATDMACQKQKQVPRPLCLCL